MEKITDIHGKRHYINGDKVTYLGEGAGTTVEGKIEATTIVSVDGKAIEVAGDIDTVAEDFE